MDLSARQLFREKNSSKFEKVIEIMQLTLSTSHFYDLISLHCVNLFAPHTFMSFTPGPTWKYAQRITPYTSPKKIYLFLLKNMGALGPNACNMYDLDWIPVWCQVNAKLTSGPYMGNILTLWKCTSLFSVGNKVYYYYYYWSCVLSYFRMLTVSSKKEAIPCLLNWALYITRIYKNG